jgi:hypothetical protein
MGFVWYGIFMIEMISNVLPKLRVLDEEDSSKNLEWVECLWKVSSTFLSLYSVICLRRTFSCRDC